MLEEGEGICLLRSSSLIIGEPSLSRDGCLSFILVGFKTIAHITSSKYPSNRTLRAVTSHVSWTQTPEAIGKTPSKSEIISPVLVSLQRDHRRPIVGAVYLLLTYHGRLHRLIGKARMAQCCKYESD